MNLQVGIGKACVGGMLVAEARSPSSTTNDAAGPENIAHLAQAGGRIRQVKQQKTEINEVEVVARQAGIESAGFDERGIRQAFDGAQFTSLFKLRPVHIDTAGTSGGSNDISEHLSHYADTASEIGNLYSFPKTGLQEYSPADRRVNVVEYVEPANRRRSRCEHIRIRA